MKSFDTVRGMRDFLPEELVRRRKVESQVQELFHLYGYKEIETPILESYALLSAKAGEEIRHRMYVFKDLGGRRVALRPEMTASVARLVVGKLRSEVKPLRLGYLSNCFRYDNPQMGRYREFWQAGFELLGSSRPEADAEILLVAGDLLQHLGLSFRIKVGHVGILRGILSAEGVKDQEQNIVMGFLDKRQLRAAAAALREMKVSEEALDIVRRMQRIEGVSVERVLQEGEQLVESNSVANEALANLSAVLSLVKEAEPKFDVHVDFGFTRGLDYYTGMIFELFVSDLDIALGGGGRYDRLVEAFGGEPTPAVGCSPGIDRIVLAMEKQGLFQVSNVKSVSVYVVSIGEKQAGMGLKLCRELHTKGIAVQSDVMGRPLSDALSSASKMGAKVTLIVGPKEAQREVVTLRDMKTKVQFEVAMGDIVEEVNKRL